MHSIDGHHEHGSSQEHELDRFQRHTADLVHDFTSGGGGGEEFLLLPWIHKLLNVFVICNAIRDGIKQVWKWHKHLEIVIVVLSPKSYLMAFAHLVGYPLLSSLITISMGTFHRCSVSA